MQTLTDTGLVGRLKEDKQGPFTAGMILEKIDAALQLISRNQGFDLDLPEKLSKFPLLTKRVENFREYAQAIPKERLAGKWWKHLGAMAIPFKRHGGNIHLYLIDDGLLSKAIPSVPELTYKRRSEFFLNRVFGLEREFRKIKGKIHLHVIAASDLTGSDVMAIKEAIAAEHESHGNYMIGASMLPFSLRRHCPTGSEVRGCPDLVVNDPKWFAERIPAWRLG